MGRKGLCVRPRRFGQKNVGKVSLIHHCFAIGRRNLSPLFIPVNSQLRRTNSFAGIFFAENVQRTILYIKAYFIFVVLFLRQNISLRRRYSCKPLRQNKLYFCQPTGLSLLLPLYPSLVSTSLFSNAHLSIFNNLKTGQANYLSCTLQKYSQSLTLYSCWVT